MSRKSVSFGQVIEYFERPVKKGPAVIHNLTSDPEDLDHIRSEFTTNSRYLPPRRNGNVLYHEIMSFHAADSESITEVALEDLIRRYLDLRAPRSLAYARTHLDTACVHVHLLISANDVESARRHRLSRSQFRRVQRDLERYQRERYPELERSIAQVPKSCRHKPTSRKQLLRASILAQLQSAQSEEAFRLRLALLGQRFYVRGKHAGVEDTHTGRRHRFLTLGIAEAYEAQRGMWERISEREQEIERVTLERVRRQWVELGFRGDMLTILDADSQLDVEMSERERECLREIEHVVRGRKLRQQEYELLSRLI
jgi:hypothetical protein